MSKEFNATHGETFLIKTCLLAIQILPRSISKVALWKAGMCSRSFTFSSVNWNLYNVNAVFQKNGSSQFYFVLSGKTKTTQRSRTKQKREIHTRCGTSSRGERSLVLPLTSIQNQTLCPRAASSLVKTRSRGVGGWNVYSPILWSDKGRCLQVFTYLPMLVSGIKRKTSSGTARRCPETVLGLYLRCIWGLCLVYLFFPGPGCPIKQPKTKRPLCVK